MGTSKSDTQFEVIYQHLSANRHENQISCRGNYLLFARCRCPVIYDLKRRKIVCILSGHNDEVDGQCFVTQRSESDSASPIFIISTSLDKTAIIWEIQRDSQRFPNASRMLHRLESPNGEPFTSRSCTWLNNQFASVTTTIDGSIYLWHDDQLTECLKTKYCYLHSRIHTVGSGDAQFTFLFLSGGDNKVHVYHVDKSLDHLMELTGHDDWIKSMDILDVPGRDEEFLLATASQDAYIRIWYLKVVTKETPQTQVRTTSSKVLGLLESKETTYRLTSTLETVLSVHEGIVHGVAWFKKQPKPILQLISCSSDKTIVVWKSSITPLSSGDDKPNMYEQQPASSEIWKESHKVGETGETNLPFLSVCISEDEKTFYAHSLRGAIHSWSFVEGQWLMGESIMGHYEPVTDLSWERSGSYLLSASLDKTCRLHAICDTDERWAEIARPQVHGNEINCIASIDFTHFASGAEEKTIRTFGATQFFLKNYKALAVPIYRPPKEADTSDMPIHAQLPALGLSNKAASSPYDIDEPDSKEGSSAAWYTRSKLVEQLAQIDHLQKRPSEEILLQSTLWWETHKLFGHANELHALAVDSTGSYMASASKANRPDLANILVWECTRFRKAATLEHHSLTVTRLRFSPDDRYLLSVSRDRTWCLSERTGQVRSAYKKLIGTVKSNSIHDRIIWDSCWTCDSKHFLTVSRDKRAILWTVESVVGSLSSSNPNDIAASVSVTTDASIQATDSLDYQLEDNSYLFALGFEDGKTQLLRVRANGGANFEWQSVIEICYHHHLPIRRLAFRPTDKIKSILLASAGDDCSVKLTQFMITLRTQ